MKDFVQIVEELTMGTLMEQPEIVDEPEHYSEESETTFEETDV
jgi:hypothetical protein